MRWDEMDMEKALWTIPAARMKGDAAHEVPLSGLAIGIAQFLPRWKGPYVFITTDGGRPISASQSQRTDRPRAGGDFPEWRYPRSTPNHAHEPEHSRFLPTSLPNSALLTQSRACTKSMTSTHIGTRKARLECGRIGSRDIGENHGAEPHVDPHSEIVVPA